MKHLRTLIVAAGVIWGAILGLVSARVVGGGVAGVFWLQIFGDNEWPSWAHGVIVTITAFSGLFVFSMCQLISWHCVRRLNRAEFENRQLYGPVIFLLIAAVLVVAGGFSYSSFRADLEMRRQQTRLEDQRKRKEEASPIRKADESGPSYYCRIVRKRSTTIRLAYKGRQINLVGALLYDRGRVLFGVAAPYRAVQALAGEIVLSAKNVPGGEPLVADFVALPDDVVCGKKIYFIQSRSTGLPFSITSYDEVDASISSIHVGFPMKIWHEPGTG